MARPGVIGEIISTVIQGRLETQRAVERPGFVVMGTQGELYIVDENKFIGSKGLYYEVVFPISIPGFKAYAHKGRVKAKQLDFDFSCEMSWGETEFIPAGGWLIHNLTVDERYDCANEGFDEGNIYTRLGG